MAKRVDGAAYCEVYDAYYDPKIKEWGEDVCSDPLCEYCSRRLVKHPENCSCLGPKAEIKVSP